MEGSENSLYRISRTIWTVWGFLTGAVGRYIRPEEANKDEPVEQEDADSSVTRVKSYRELKEEEEEKERCEATAWSQSERPQGSVKVRAAAAQWEKVHGGVTSKPTSTGVECNTAVQGGQLEYVDKKVEEQRGPEEILDNNNEAVQTKSHDFVEKVDPDIGSQDSGVSGPFDKDAGDKGDESMIGHMMERQHAVKEEEAMQNDSEQGEGRDFGDAEDFTEAAVEKVMEHTGQQDENEENDDEQKNQVMTEDENEASATQTADDLLSQLTYSTREGRDLLNKEIKVEEATENEATSTPEREVNNEEMQQGTVGMEKDEQHEAGQREFIGSENVESRLDGAQHEFIEGVVETECIFLTEPMTSQMESKEMHENEAEPISQSTEYGSALTRERVNIAIIDEETEQEPVRTAKDGQHEAVQLLSEFKDCADKLDQAGSKLDEAQNELTEETVETKCEHLEGPKPGQIENAEIYVKDPEPLCRTENKVALIPEGDSIDGTEERKQGTVEVKDQEGQLFNDSKIMEVLDICESRQDEKCVEKSKENEAAVTSEREVLDVRGEEIDQEAVGMVEEASQKLNESKATEIDVLESKLDEAQVEFIEGIVGNESKRLEELVMEHLEDKETYKKEAEPALTPENELIDTIDIIKQETMGTAVDGQPGVDQQLSEIHGSEIDDGLDICESNLVEAQNELTEGTVDTKHESLEGPVMEHLDDEEMYEKEAEPISYSIQTKAALTPERELIDTIEATKQEIIRTAEDGQHGVDQQLREYQSSEIANKMDTCESNLVEAQNELAEEVMESWMKSKLDEAQAEFIEGIVGNESKLLEEPVMEHLDDEEMYEKEAEPISYSIQTKAAMTPEMELIDTIEAMKQETMGTAVDGQPGVDQQLSETHGSETDKLDISELNLVEAQNELAEEVMESWMKSKLDEAQAEFIKGVMRNESKLLEEPVMEHLDDEEMYEKEAEPISYSIQTKAALTPERELIDTIEAMKQETMGTAVDGQPGVDQQLREYQSSEISNKMDTCESNLVEAQIELIEGKVESWMKSKLDEAQAEFIEGIVGNESKLLEEPVMEHLDDEEMYEKEAEPISYSIQTKAAMTPERELIDTIEVTKQEIMGTAVDGQPGVDQQLSEIHVSESDEKLDICESNLVDAQNELAEGTVDTKHESLKEPVMEHLDDEEMYEKEAEPISYSIQTKAALTPERELIDTIEAMKQKTMGTAVDGQHGVDQQLREYQGSEIPDKMDTCESNLVEAHNELTEGIVDTKHESLKEPVIGHLENAEMCEKEPKPTREGGLVKTATGDESWNCDLSAVTMEADELERGKEDTEAGNALELALKTEVEPLDLTACVISGSQIPEVTIKQDSELVVVGSGNQSETSETTMKFQQEARAEVAAYDVKKPAEMDRSLQPTARQEMLSQCPLEQGSLQEKSVDESAHELGVSDASSSEMQGDASKFSSAGQEDEAADDELSNPSPQELDGTQDAIEGSVELVTELATEKTKATFTEQKVEVLEAMCDHDMAEAKCEQAESERDPEKEAESPLATVELYKKSTEAEVSVPEDGSGSQIRKHCGERTVQDGSDDDETEPLGQIRYSGILELPERESASKVSEMLGGPEEDAEDAELTERKPVELKRDTDEEAESPDETEIGLLKAMTASLGDGEKIMIGLEKTAMETSELNRSELQDHRELSSNLVKNEQDLETMDIDAMVCGEVPQNATEEHDNKHVENVDAATVMDSNESLKEINKSGLKRGSEKMAEDEEDKPSLVKGWAAPEFLLQQVSSLDCTAQKSKIAVKNRCARPPKNPRTLINMASMEPSAPPHPAQPSPLRKGQGEGIPGARQGVIGFKLPGLGAGLPILRKTEAGKKMWDGGDAQTQKPDVQTDLKEDCVKEQPANKPKWTPPRHPGMGNPMMMSELKSKLRKTGKD